MPKRSNKMVTHKMGRMRVSYTPQSRGLLTEHSKAVKKEAKAKGLSGTYSVFRDLITPSNRLSVKKIDGKCYIITPSKPFVGILTDVNVTPSRTIARKGGGPVETVYWLKRLQGSSEQKRVFVKDQRDQKSLRLEKREIEDARRQQRRVGIGVPNFVLRVEPTDRSRRITVTELLEGVEPVDKFVQSLPRAKKEKIIRQVNELGLSLIKKGLFPTQTKGDHILISKDAPAKFFIADSAVGFTPTSLNRLMLLQTLKEDPSIRRPDWNSVHRSFSGMQRYWKSLPKEARERIQVRQLNMLLDEIHRGPGARPPWQKLAKKVDALVLEMFSNCKYAQEIRERVR